MVRSWNVHAFLFELPVELEGTEPCLLSESDEALFLSSIGVSFGFVLGRVESGSRESAPPSRYTVNHRSSVRLPYGHVFIISSDPILP